MTEYGFQRLVLLGSAGYERAELPLDDAVSLVAPNNIGKTSLINALQYLLIINGQRMDFGSHDRDTSRRFYFPTNSAYILLEAVLPEVGSVVMGCVGRGFSHDYTYFDYQGQLDVEQFRLPDGSIVPESRLNAHFESQGLLISRREPGEFAALMYGGARRRGTQPFTAFRLEDTRNASTYQSVLTRTLRLDKLRSDEVKRYLLEIFRNSLPGQDVDFKAIWENAFAEASADRAQYRAALDQVKLIENLDTRMTRLRELRGRVLHTRPLIDEALLAWQGHYEGEREVLAVAVNQVRQEAQALDARSGEWVLAEDRARRDIDALDDIEREQAVLANQYSLVPNIEMLEARHAQAKTAYEAQVVLVGQANRTSPAQLRKQIVNVNHQRDSTRRQLAHLGDNLYLSLAKRLAPATLGALNRVLSRDAMALPPAAFTLDDALAVRDGDDASLQLAGMHLHIATLAPQFTQKTAAELEDEIAEFDKQLAELDAQLTTAEAMETATRRQQALEREVREAERDLQAYARLLTLAAAQEERALQRATLKARAEDLRLRLAGLDEERQRCREQERAHEASLNRLNQQHEEIARLRRERVDAEPLFDDLAEMRHTPWVGSFTIELNQLSDRLQAFVQACQDLLRLSDEIISALRAIRLAGLTKFENTSDSEREVEQIIEFGRLLPQEAEALARKERGAIINVAVSLRQLRNDLDSFKSQMQGFNRAISGRQLSDLKTFAIRPREDDKLVAALDVINSAAEKADAGDTFELFNQASLVDDSAIAAAKELLIKAGQANGCLRVENLFDLEFVVGKEGQTAESFRDIDSAASNGTVLMAKLITGLALLHLMQDKRHQVRGVCYLDEASALDPRNQRNLIETAREFGFALIFASPAPQLTARYCVPITVSRGRKRISRLSWQLFEPLGAEGAPA